MPNYLNLWRGKRGEEAHVKCIGIRGAFDPQGANALGVYDDDFILCIGSTWTSWKGSTDPGQFYVQHPINPQGCAQLKEGIHLFKVGVHQGLQMVFVQAEDVHVNRLDRTGTVEGVAFGDFGIQLSSGGPGNEVDRFSAGNQVIWSPEGAYGDTWHRFFDPAVAAMAGAAQTLLPYLLIDEADAEVALAEAAQPVAASDPAQPAPSSDVAGVPDRPVLRAIPVTDFDGVPVAVVTMTPVAAPGESVMAAPATPVQTPRLPDYAVNLLSAQQGVPWQKANLVEGADGYTGILPGSCHRFQGLAGLPGGVSAAVYYECKLDIDGDGVSSNDAGDSTKQSATTLRHADGGSLDATQDVFAVLPLDAREASDEFEDDPRFVKRRGLPDFGKNLGLQIGDLGVAFWRRKGTGDVQRAFFIYGDKGPPNKLGEGSIRMAAMLGVPSNPNTGGLSSDEIREFGKGVVHLGFVGSGSPVAGARNRTTLSAADVMERGAALLAAFLRG